MSIFTRAKADRREETESRTSSPYRHYPIRRYLWEFLLYFLRPIIITYIIGYFGWQSLKSIAYAVSAYERAVAKEDIKAWNGGETFTKHKQGRMAKRKGKDTKENENSKYRDIQ